MAKMSMLPKSNLLLPVHGCRVKRREDASKEVGVVIESKIHMNVAYVKVLWQNRTQTQEVSTNLQSGFMWGASVEDVSQSNARRTLGIGRVVSVREIGGRQQLLVQLESDGACVWVPYEHLRSVSGVRTRYLARLTNADDCADRFRLKMLANALENWNQLTGSLDRLPVDALPHQIQLVHRILSSGNHSWIIADDVGLGKTIEMGLVLAGLTRRGLARRVLIVCPAGLQLQWQQELALKFNQDYKIYGIDFRQGAFNAFSKVIVSIDRAKNQNHAQLFIENEGWDVIVFDEAHKLTRYASGYKSERYRFSEFLRKKANSFFLLTGTPHQGYTDRFIALLQLVRPDLTRRLRNFDDDRDVVAEIILRNRKSSVTDSDGNFIFKGLSVKRVSVESSLEMNQFQLKLKEYLQRGYRAGDAKGERAIGFVMTIYRKLASSSIAAINVALDRRLKRLLEDSEAPQINVDTEELENLVEGGDDQYDLHEKISELSGSSFFAAETKMVRDLIEISKQARAYDEKLFHFMEKIVEPLFWERKNLLIFTEYRATQDYIVDSLRERYSKLITILTINGSMSVDEKLTTVAKFNDVTDNSVKFLISTEAGGEGINLQHSCHIIVNYDLPWNPARLLQRMGRLYRYGQKSPVHVFNLHTTDSFDNAAIDLLFSRVNSMATGMATVGKEFNSRLYSDILGDVLENLDLSRILSSSQNMDIERTREDIESALENAKFAKKIQDDLLSAVTGFDPHALEGTVGFTMEHVLAFIVGMLPRVNVQISNSLHGGRVLECRLPDDLTGRFHEFANRSVVRITADRRLAERSSETVIMDFENQFFRFLIHDAKSYSFNGLYASIAADKFPHGTLLGAKLRWQNAQCAAGPEEFVTLFRDKSGKIITNPRFLTDWFKEHCVSIAENFGLDAVIREEIYQELQNQLNLHMGRECNQFKHPNDIVNIAIGEIH